MDIVTAVLCILLGLILFLMALPDAKQSRIKQLLNKLPGPPTYPIIGTAWEMITSPLQRHAEIYTKYNKTYGNIFRTWAGSRGIVVISSPEAAELFLSSNVHINRSQEYLAFTEWLGESFVLKQGQEWRKLRKMSVPAFSPSTLDIYFEVFKNNAEILVETLKNKVSAGEFDVYPHIIFYTLDTIFETGLGFKLNAQNNNNKTYANYLEIVGKSVAEMIHHPWLFSKHFFDPSGLRKKYDESLAFCHQFVNSMFGIRVGDKDEVMKNIIDLSMKGIQISEVQKKNKDMMGLLMNTASKEYLINNLQGLIFAGHETTASGLSWAIQLLGEHTDLQEKVYEEMTRIFDGSDRRPTKEDLEQMEYLDRVIKEALRLYPSVSAISRLIETDIQIGQYTIPAGVSVCIHIYCIHRNPECYPNPEEFNPDNFLPERVRDRHPYAFIPFSAGPRNCLGQKFAMMEMKTALSLIVRNFKIRSVNKTKDLLPVFAVTVTSHTGFHIELTLRGKK